jgi:predicted NBD/HSP70 family sugar kinase
MEKKGYKIGFDAGGSDRKVTSTINGEVVFDSEDIWFPKLNSDPEYHINGIKDSINRAKDALGGRVDAIGVSTAGIVVDNEIRVASLFLKVPEEVYPEKIVPIYKNLGKEYSCPVKVANDGDVAALAGAFSLGEGRILGIAMGTSEAAGYVDENFNIKGYLNELAFAPVDANINAPKDEWSGDKGVGSAYHSQDAVIRLAKELRIEINEELSPAEKLKSVQNLTNAGEKRGIEIFEKLGEYFGYSILWYQNFYPLKKCFYWVG